MRVVLLNGLPLNAFPFEFFSLNIQKVELKQIKQTIEYYAGNVIVSNYIRHPATVQLLSTALNMQLQANAGLYQYVPGDRIYVVVLNSPQRGQETLEISENDITVYKIQISEVVR